jgi:MFS family permease
VPKPLPRAVRTLGAVSLLTDASSEMIYPLLPSFLSGVLGAGPAFLGLVEGAAEAVASACKLLAGRLSDRTRRRKPFVVFGYGLSTFARPLVALAASPWHVLAVRLADRFGKGVRGAPRDALLAAVTPESERGRAFGFHRAMDHAGATIGPLLATAAMLAGADLRAVFALAFVPGLLALLVLALGVREEPAPGLAPALPLRPGLEQPTSPSPPELPDGNRRTLHLYLAVLALFALGNSSDAFLLLRAQELGVSLAMIPLLWTFHHVVKAGLSTFGGRVSDRHGRRQVLIAGWAVYAAAYVGFAFAAGPLATALLFAIYGLFHALTEGPEKAFVADLAPAGERGRAFGLFHAVTGIMILPGNLLTGYLWQRFGAGVALLTGAALAGVAAALLLVLVKENAGPAPRGEARLRAAKNAVDPRAPSD